MTTRQLIKKLEEVRDDIKDDIDTYNRIDKLIEKLKKEGVKEYAKFNLWVRQNKNS